MMDISNIFTSLLIMAEYAFLVLFVPSVVMKKRLSNQRMYERFMIYVVFGNFYIINIVFILQLMHISNMFTLLLFYTGPVLYVLIKPHSKELCRFFYRAVDTTDRLVKGSLGKRTFLKKCRLEIKKYLKRCLEELSFIKNRQNIEGVAVAALVIIICVMYGSNSIKNYGYLASDIAVHNYWINGMLENKIFIAGVYPHGFHCIIYFMHEIFRIDVSVLLRLFAMTSAVFVHMVLWAFIRYVTKSRYAAYGAVVIFTSVNFMNSGCYSRYSCNLPQEYGIIFILPTFYFLFEYMRHQRTRQEKDKAYRARIRYELAGAAASFSLTISVHFYGTMIVGLICVAMVFAYWKRFIKPEFFLRLMAALFAGIIIAALPMGVSIAQGNHFQGSIGWGLNVIMGSKESTQKTGTVSKSEGFDEDMKAAGIVQETDGDTDVPENESVSDKDDKKSDISIFEGNSQKQEKKSAISKLTQKVSDKLKSIYAGFRSTVRYSVVYDYSNIWAAAMLISMAAIFAYGVVLVIKDWNDYDSDYGNWYITMALGVLFTALILISTYLKIPAIMDVNRGRIYYMYCFTVLMGIVLDMIPGIISQFVKRKWIYNIPSLVISLTVVCCLFAVYGVRPVAINSRLNLMQTNGAVYCMYKIMDEHEDDNWTIVSPTDELRMLGDRGYHYELSEFIKRLKRSIKFSLPTKEVYVFIEKKPLDYTIINNKYSGMEVSREGASQTYDDYYSGNNMYKGETRYILMSKAYYWAERYMEVYPEDFSVYYEDDEFVCYKLVQNTSFLNNLMIDYGYNK